MAAARLPNLIIVGAAKAGTTSLYAYLARHPDVFMSPVKEPRFFAWEGEDPSSFRGPGAQQLINSIVQTQEAYEALFAGASYHLVRGEASTAYLHSPVAATRIHALIPAAKIVAILRDPADRAYSAWLDNVSTGYEPVRDFDRTLDLVEQRRRENWGPKWDYLGGGLYAEQLRRYL